MNIKNYTSTVAPEKSQGQIEKILIEMGARRIAKEYDGFGKISAMMFSFPNGESDIPFRLPAKVDPIILLYSHGKRLTQAQRKAIEEQAARTAWKNVREWVELQATMIKLGQVEFNEVFMPYMYSMSEGKTFYQITKEKGFEFKQLSA